MSQVARSCRVGVNKTECHTNCMILRLEKCTRYCFNTQDYDVGRGFSYYQGGLFNLLDITDNITTNRSARVCFNRGSTT